MVRYTYDEMYFNSNKISNYGLYYNNPFNKRLYNFLVKRVKGGRLLELGCAYGYFLSYAEKTYNTTGIDISKFALNKARNLTKKSKLIYMDIGKKLPRFLLRRKYDIIVALDVLEHIKEPQILLKSIEKSLDKDGIFILRVPNTESLEYIFLSMLKKNKKWRGYKDKTHISVYSLQEWIYLLKTLNFYCKLMPYFPTKFLKKFVSKYLPNLFFLSPIFRFFNLSITIVCTKNDTNKPS